MTASVPLLTMRTISMGPTTEQISSAISTSRWVAAPKLRPSAMARCTACWTTGSQWPKIMGPQEPT